MNGFLKQFNKKHHNTTTTTTTNNNTALATNTPIAHALQQEQNSNNNLIPSLDRSLSDNSTQSASMPRSVPTNIELPSSPSKGSAFKNWLAELSPNHHHNNNNIINHQQRHHHSASNGSIGNKNHSSTNFTYSKKTNDKNNSNNTIMSIDNGRKVFDTPLITSMEVVKCEIVISNGLNDKKFGYVPVVIAKCGSIIKQYGLTTPGIFRKSGNKKKIDYLINNYFANEPFYGLDFTYDYQTGKNQEYSIHEFSSLFKTYLNRLTEPVIPYENFDSFINCIKEYPAMINYYDNITNPDILDKTTIKYENENQMKDIKELLKKYYLLIHNLPEANRELLIYVFDLLDMIQKRSSVNLMTCENISIVFQPSLLSHLEFSTDLQSNRLARYTLQFLVENFDTLANTYLGVKSS
ncbi:similar to Saccharomyces cerevisiae YDR389W SAC7 GTPase activating protein (GAP) for Rho1p [Maudiozyma saulgeensis]|uniref:Similar to Saccharomyces cerevisiae YDR389W SAC7 GTPase activating protein (GAP) for Rho1p n=1 Tax=Maudiozyma saulgeensis TaxID=1789683 RepID=A0A1X7QZB6_9SACH|nr:similar to Saccharomyces cerevisiae YDR389W SAC7 GTPase activating protein (GAP) for Rho1p [Kazachstania saulgeensis]